MTLLRLTDSADRTPREKSPSSYAWFIVALLWVVAMVNYIDRLMITTMRDPIRADITITDAQFGLLTSVFLWVYAFVSPLGGYLADRYSRRWVITSSLLFWSIATFLTGLAHTFPQLLLARALMGLSEACYLPAALALICDYHPGPTRSFATGLHMSGLSAGAALGGIGGYLAEHYGWRDGFKGLGIAGFSYGVLVLFTLRDATLNATFQPEAARASETKVQSAAGALTGGLRSSLKASAGEGAGGTEEASPSTDFRGRPLTLDYADPTTNSHTSLSSLFAKPAFQILFLINILVGMSNWTIYGWLPTYLKDHFRLGLGAAGLSATGYVQAAAFAGVFAGGFIADRWSKTNGRARSLTPALFYILAGPCLFAAASTTALPLAIAGLIVFGLARGAFDANHMPILRQITHEKHSATAFGVVNLISCAAGGAMVYIGGALSDAHVSLSRIFQVCGVALAVVGLLLIFIVPSADEEKIFIHE